MYSIKTRNCRISLVCYICVWLACSEVLSPALQQDRSVWQPFLLIMFSKHIFHLLLTVPCPHLSYPPPPFSFGPHFNSLRLYHQLVYYLNLKLGERNEIIEVLSAINPVWHYYRQTLWKLAWRIWATNTTSRVSDWCFSLCSSRIY